MTVCIAAASTPGDGPQYLVLCSDWRVSSALGFADTMYKEHMLTRGWRLLGAGTDSEILRLVILMRESFISAGEIDDTNITTTIRAALNARKKEKVEEYVQGRYAISYSDFLNLGKDKLPADIYREAMMAIAAITLNTSTIIAGFIDGFPTIVHTTEQCGAHIREDFATIGEGSYLAQATLLQREQSTTDNLGATIYQVYEAKKSAERLGSVGPNTAISVFANNGKRWRVGHKSGDLLDRLVSKFGPQKIVLKDLKEVIGSLEETD